MANFPGADGARGDMPELCGFDDVRDVAWRYLFFVAIFGFNVNIWADFTVNE